MAGRRTRHTAHARSPRLFALMLLLVGFGGGALAFEAAAQGAASERISADEGASGSVSWLNIEPRFWASFVKTVNFDNLAKEVIFVPMGGASVTLTPPGFSNFSLLVTGLYGQGSGAAVEDGFVGADEIERIDVEGLIRYRLPDTNLSIFTGARYVTFNETICEVSPCVRSLSIINDTQLILVEFGVSGFGNLTPSGRHRIFGNMIAGVGFRETDYVDPRDFSSAFSESQTEPSFDLNIGYQFLATDMISLSFRYRAFMYFVAQNDFGLGDILLAHGPEFGLSVRF